MNRDSLHKFERLVSTLREQGWTVSMDAERPYSFFATRGTEYWWDTPYYLYVSAERRFFGKLHSPKNTARRQIERRLRTWREAQSAARIYGRPA